MMIISLEAIVFASRFRQIFTLHGHYAIGFAAIDAAA